MSNRYTFSKEDRVKGGKRVQEKNKQNQWTQEQALFYSRNAIEKRWRKYKVTLDIEKVLLAFNQVLCEIDVYYDHNFGIRLSDEMIEQYTQQLKEKLQNEV